MKNKLFIFCLLTLISCNKTVNYEKERDYFNEENGIVYYKGSPFSGTLLGHLEKSKYKDGKLDGAYESYFSNGTLQTKKNYIDNQEDGVIEEFYKNGQLKEKKNISDGLFVGVREEFFENGNLKKKTIYDDNSSFVEINFPEVLLDYKFNKNECSVYDIEGDIGFYIDTRNNELKITGNHWGGSVLNTLLNNEKKNEIELLIIHEVWHEDYLARNDTLNLSISKKGKVSLNFDNKKINYLSCNNGINNNIILVKNEIEVVDKVVIEDYHKNGGLKSLHKRIDGLMEGLQFEYFENGQLKIKKHFKNNEQFGLYEEYYESGQLKEKYNKYKRYPYPEFFDGVYESYFENGQLSEKTFYSDSKKNGKYESYFENGQLKYTVNFVNGKESGTSKKFKHDGALESQLEWENGNENGYKLDRLGCGYKVKIYLENGREVSWEVFDTYGKKITYSEYQSICPQF